jgi:hypothetical protein
MRNTCIPEGARVLILRDASGTAVRAVKLSDQLHLSRPLVGSFG